MINLLRAKNLCLNFLSRRQTLQNLCRDWAAYTRHGRHFGASYPMAAGHGGERKSGVEGGLQKPYVCILTSHFNDLAPRLTNICSSAKFVHIGDKGITTESLQDAEIIIADPGLILPFTFQLPKLKWVQSTYAGVEPVLKNVSPDGPRPSFVLTRLAGFFGPIMAEYVIGHIIAQERKFKVLWEGQKIKKWVDALDVKYRLMSELTIGIIGFGNIGQDIAKYCKSMNMTVNVVQREVSSPKFPFVDKAFSLRDLPECLRHCDYFCNVLPSTPATRGLLNGSVLESCKEKKTVFINIGRGDIIDNDTILKALDEQWIGGAILDVFEVEPLPTSSPLWSHPEVTITSHISGLAWENEIIPVFLENFAAYQSDKPLKYAVDWNKGY